MELATYEENGIRKVGVLNKLATGLYDINIFGIMATDMLTVIQQLTSDVRLSLSDKLAVCEKKAVPLSAVKLLAPLPEPRQDIICLGINYAAHARESESFTAIEYKEKAPAIYFSKRVNEAVAPFGYIDSHSDIVNDLDYEVELAAVIGRDALNVTADEAADYIFGYTIINDVSARQLQSLHKQWYRGKSLDNFTPMGPWLVTADEIAYPPQLNIKCSVNGQIRQQSNTANMLHDLTAVIVELSAGMTLKAGTIIATGTPSGVAMGMKDPVYLQPGDIVECEIERIGVLKNIVK